MTRTKLLTILLLIASVSLVSFTVNEAVPMQRKNAGKAWWYSYYVNDPAKKIYITEVYNNDCYYCNNETSEAFKKWLIMNDYDHKASTLHIICLRDSKESSAKERRDETIYKYKQKDYAVIKVGFTYKED